MGGFGRKAPKSVLLIGNPLIMKQLAKFVPDAGSYATVTVLVDERPDLDRTGSSFETGRGTKPIPGATAKRQYADCGDAQARFSAKHG